MVSLNNASFLNFVEYGRRYLVFDGWFTSSPWFFSQLEQLWDWYFTDGVVSVFSGNLASVLWFFGGVELPYWEGQRMPANFVYYLPKN